MNLRLRFVFLGFLSTVTCYLTQNKPIQRSINPLQLSLENNVLYPSQVGSKLMKNKNVVLDVNCEKGESTNRLQDIFFNYKVIGFDKEEDNIVEAKKKYPNQHFACIDFDSSIFPYYSMRESCVFINVNSYQDLETTIVKCHFLLEYDGKFILPLKASDEKISKMLQEYKLNMPFRRHGNCIEFIKKGRLP